jgi:hypothetical protein
MLEPEGVRMSYEVVHDLAEAASRAAHGERVTIRQHGAEIALIPVADLQALEALEALEDQQDIARALVSLEEGEREGVIPWEQVKAEAGLPPCATE